MGEEIRLFINNEGKFKLYEEVYTTLEILTEEDFNRLQYLLRLGQAAEDAFKLELIGLNFENAQELLEWAEGEG